MTGYTDLIQWETTSGQPMTVGDLSITPQSQALTIRWPLGGFVWNRPVAVLVAQDGDTERIPVTDVTLMAHLGLLVLSVLFTLIGVLSAGRRGRDQNG